MGGLVFFYIGGSKWLRGVQKRCGVLAVPSSSANGKANGNGTSTGEKNLSVPPSLDKVVPPPS